MAQPAEKFTEWSSIDLSDPDTFNTGFPHEFFRYLRRQAPVYHHAHCSKGEEGFFVLSKHHDIREASKNPGLFCSSQGINIVNPPSQNDGVEYGQSSMIYMDPPEHIRNRKLISTLFMPRHLEKLEPHILQLARNIVDQAASKGKCDFVLDIASELPLQVIAEFVGVPQKKRHVLFECSNKMVGNEDPEYATSEHSMAEAAIQLYTLGNELLEERRRDPKDDIITRLMNAEVDGEKLSADEFSGFFVLLANAGNETTRNQTSQGLRLLLQHPEQKEELIAHLDDDEYMKRAVEEMLRYSAPVMYFCRTATRDTEIRGVEIKKDQRIALYYPSANRDEEVFENPDAFDISRHPNPHLSFGAGEHFCLGASLARMQLRSIFRAILERLPDIQLDGEISHLRSHLIDGIKHMPVRYTPS